MSPSTAATIEAPVLVVGAGPVRAAVTESEGDCG